MAERIFSLPILASSVSESILTTPSSHTYHQRYTLYPEADRENLLPLEPKLGSVFVLQLFTINLLTQPGRTFSKGGLIAAVICTIRSAFGKEGPPDIPSQEWLASLHTDQPEEHKKSMWWSQVLLRFYGSLLVVSLVRLEEKKTWPNRVSTAACLSFHLPPALGSFGSSPPVPSLQTGDPMSFLCLNIVV